MNAIVNFAQIVKKATCLMTISQYNYNNSLAPKFMWALLKKRIIWIKLINIATKVDERYMTQISFRTQGPNIRTGTCTIRNPCQNSQPIHNPLSVYLTQNSQSVLFLRPNPSVQTPIHPSPICPVIPLLITWSISSAVSSSYRFNKLVNKT